MSEIQIGRLLRANSRGCVAGCQVSQPLPAFGSMVNITIDQTDMVYGLITNIHIDDDGLVRQLAVSGDIPEEIIQDNRLNRNVPVELSVVFIGYMADRKVIHLLPPRPPLSLDGMISCSDLEICAFTGSGRFAYLRHLFAVEDITPADLIAAHFMQAARAQQAAGNPDWIRDAMQAAVQLLRDDYDQLSAVLIACGGIFDSKALEGREE
jgi:hypothetical protein